MTTAQAKDKKSKGAGHVQKTSPFGPISSEGRCRGVVAVKTSREGFPLGKTVRRGCGDSVH